MMKNSEINTVNNYIDLLLKEAKKNRQLAKKHTTGSVNYWRVIQLNIGIIASIKLLQKHKKGEI